MGEPRERQILFNDEMVRAILDGRKTQTRRPVTPQPKGIEPTLEPSGKWVWWRVENDRNAWDERRCPFGFPGDRLWVREAWRFHDWTDDGLPWIEYRADGATLFRDADVVPEEWCDRLMDIWANLSDPENYARHGRATDPKWRASIHMPRWASRITLEITDLRVERVQEITETEAIREGVSGGAYHRDFWVGAFRDTWDATYAQRGYGWAENPWVWVISFRRADR